MTRIGQLPSTTTALDPSDYVEGERASSGDSERWTIAQLVAGLLTDPSFSGVVIVPDATANGQALAFGQSGVQLVSPTFTGNVVVPDANADGEALAYDQSNVRSIGQADAASRHIFRLGSGAAATHGIEFQTNGSSTQHELTMDAAATMRMTRSGVTYFQVVAAGDVNMTGAPSVAVPDATADGQALAHSQNNAVLGVNTDIAYGKVDLRAVKLGGTVIKRNQTSGDWGALEVFDGADRVLFRVSTDIVSSGTGVDVDMSSSDAVKIPAATAATHAAQVSAIDATTGRLAIGGIEMGDTRARDINSLCVNGWDFNAHFTIRRTGNLVTITADASTTSTATANLIATLPVGFRPTENIRPGWMKDYASSKLDMPMVSGYLSTLGAFYCEEFGTSSRIAVVFSYGTDDAWPSSLPGTAA